MLPLETKLCVRCASREEKRRITNDVFVRQVLFSVLFHVISPSYGVFTMSNEEIFERCVQLAQPQRQAQLARKESRGEIAVGEHDIVLTDADLKDAQRFSGVSFPKYSWQYTAANDRDAVWHTTDNIVNAACALPIFARSPCRTEQNETGACARHHCSLRLPFFQAQLISRRWFSLQFV